MIATAAVPSSGAGSLRGPAVRLTAVCAGIALVLLSVFGAVARRTVPVGESALSAPQTRPTAHSNQSDAEARREAAERGIDLDNLSDTVRHAVTPVPGRPEVLESSDPGYQARYDSRGFSLTLGGGRVGVQLTGVRVGGTPVGLRPGAWAGDRNVAERGVGSTITERVTAHAAELEWDLVPGASALARDGDLVAQGAPRRARRHADPRR